MTIFYEYSSSFKLREVAGIVERTPTQDLIQLSSILPVTPFPAKGPCGTMLSCSSIFFNLGQHCLSFTFMTLTFLNNYSSYFTENLSAWVFRLCSHEQAQVRYCWPEGYRNCSFLCNLLGSTLCPFISLEADGNRDISRDNACSWVKPPCFIPFYPLLLASLEVSYLDQSSLRWLPNHYFLNHRSLCVYLLAGFVLQGTAFSSLPSLCVYIGIDSRVPISPTGL